MQEHNRLRIAVIRGDGIGPEVIEGALQILELLTAGSERGIELVDVLMGGCSIDAEGVPVTEGAMQQLLGADAVLLGAVGGPKWDHLPAHERPEAALLALRKQAKAWANLRPVRVPEQMVSASPLKSELVAGVDLLVVRELIGGVYFGEPRGREDQRAWNTWEYSRDQIERIARRALEMARRRSNRVVSVDKSNVLEVMQLWRDTVTDLHAAEYQDVELTHMLVDNAAMQLVSAPLQFDVILADNIFGDILSDAAAVLAGTLGVLPSVSSGDGVAIYEPISGSAPDIAGQGIANPTAAIHCVGMLLDDLMPELQALKRLDLAFQKQLSDGVATRDMGGTASTQQVVDAISAHLAS